MKSSLGISDFLEEISSLSHSIVFLYFFAVITKEGFLISPCYSLELCIQMGISFVFSFAFRFSSTYSYLQGLLMRGALRRKREAVELPSAKPRSRGEVSLLSTNPAPTVSEKQSDATQVLPKQFLFTE